MARTFTAADDENAAQAVISVLTTEIRHLDKVNFQYNQFLVTGSGYQTVMLYVAGKSIKCLVEPIPRSADIDPLSVEAAQYIPGPGDQYNRPPDTFCFPNRSYSVTPGLGVFSHLRPTIVHEATHAMFDIARLGMVLGADDECCAFLAEALYGQASSNLQRGDVNSPSGAARQLAEHIVKDRENRRLPTNAIYPMTAQLFAPLRSAICAAYGFVGSKAGVSADYDGVPPPQPPSVFRW
jgi:hypothetical protein